MKVQLTTDQDNAVNKFLDFLVGEENFMVIEGAAGVGKSFLIKHLLETFYAKYSAYCLLLHTTPKKFDISITATTNKAVRVVEDFLSDLIDRRSDLSVSTIFSLLGLKVVNNRETGKTNLTFNAKKAFIPKTGDEASLIFIDESSFIGEDLQQIIDQILTGEPNTKVVYIGDPYQLAPVGQQFSAMDYVQASRVALKEVLRNGGDILKEGTKFRHTVETGVFTPIEYNQTTMRHVDGQTFQALIEASFSDPAWTPDESKILAWTNQRVQQYNKHIRDHMGMPDVFQENEMVITNEFIRGNGNFSRSVDSAVRVTMVDKNETSFYDVPGRMVELDHAYLGFMPTDFAAVKLKLKQLAKEKDWKVYFEIKETWLDLRAAYASSVHKSQGSTYQTVFIDLSDIGSNWNADDVARLMYVSITRAAKQVICYGQLPGRYT